MGKKNASSSTENQLPVFTVEAQSMKREKLGKIKLPQMKIEDALATLESLIQQGVEAGATVILGTLTLKK